MSRRVSTRRRAFAVGAILGLTGAVAAIVPAASGATGTTPTTVSVSAPSSVSLGGNATFTATVQGSATGTVLFMLQGTVLSCGQVTLVASGGSASATCNATALPGPAGPAIVVAIYSGDSSDAPASGHAYTELDAATTSTTLTSSTNPVAQGSSTTYTATVSGATSGSVVFSDNGTPIAACGGSSGTPLSSGSASCTESTFATTGQNLILASYAGDTSSAPSTSAPLTEVVGTPGSLTATTTALASSTSAAAPATVGTDLTLVATVTTASATTVGGTVSFTDGAGVLAGCANLSVTAVTGTGTGQATCDLSSGLATDGMHTITALYLGDGATGVAASAVQSSFYVQPRRDALTIAASSDPVAAGSGVTLTTRVTPTPAGSGWMQFADSNGNITCAGSSTGQVAVAGGVATCVVTAGTAGYYDYTATYTDSGATLAPALADISETVESSVSGVGSTASDTSIEIQPGAPAAGTNVTVQATVSGASGTPTNGVRFEANGYILGSCNVALDSSGVAACTATLPGVSPTNISAFYSGDSTYAQSAAAIVLDAGSTGGTPAPVSIAISPSNPVSGASVTYAASVGGSSPTGTVSFALDGSPISGCTSLALATATASCTTTAGAAGAHDVFVTYNGDSTNSAGAGLIAAPVSSAVASGSGGGGAAPGGGSAPTSGSGGSSTPAGGSTTASAPPTGTTSTPSGTSSTGGTSATSGTGGTTSNSAGSGATSTPTSKSGWTSRPAKATLFVEVPALGTVNHRVTYRARLVGGSGAPGGSVTFTVNGIPVHGCTRVHLGSARRVTCALTTGYAHAGNFVVGVHYSGSRTLSGARVTRTERIAPGWHGLWLLSGSGRVVALGGALTVHQPRRALSHPVALAHTADDRGYWVLAANGAVRAVGDAHVFGHAAEHVGAYVDLAPLPSDHGYYLLVASGRVVARGSARLHPAAPHARHSGHAVAIAVTADGAGYWILWRDGTLTPHGDATRIIGARRRAGTTFVAFSPTADGRGALLLTARGAVIARGHVRNLGSAPRKGLIDAVALVPTGDERGYWLLGRDGRIFGFGDARHGVGHLPRTVSRVAPLRAAAGT